jgi:hypothetical protein
MLPWFKRQFSGDKKGVPSNKRNTFFILTDIIHSIRQRFAERINGITDETPSINQRAGRSHTGFFACLILTPNVAGKPHAITFGCLFLYDAAGGYSVPGNRISHKPDVHFAGLEPRFPEKIGAHLRDIGLGHQSL